MFDRKIFCSEKRLNIFLTENNIYNNNQELWDVIIDDGHCSHIINHKNGITSICNRKRYLSYRYCKIHLPKEKIKCSHENCKRNVRHINGLCVYHSPNTTARSIVKLTFNFNYLYDFLNIKNNTKKYEQKIYIKNIYVIIEHKRYTNSLKGINSLVNYFNIKHYIYDLYLLLKKYNIKKIIYNDRISEINKNMSISPQIKKNIKEELPPLPEQTEDEKLLLSYNVIYHDNNIIKNIKNSDEYINLKRSYMLCENENKILKSDFENLRNNKIKYLNYNEIKENNYVSQIMNINHNLKMDIKKLEEKNNSLHKEIKNSNLNMNINKKLNINYLEPIIIDPIEINEIKQLKNDIYFKNKEIVEISTELKKYKKFNNEIMDFIYKNGFNNSIELEDFIDKYSNRNRYLSCYKTESFEIVPYDTTKQNIYNDIYCILNVFLHLFNVIFNMVDKKEMSTNIFRNHIDKKSWLIIKKYIEYNSHKVFIKSVKNDTLKYIMDMDENICRINDVLKIYE